MYDVECMARSMYALVPSFLFLLAAGRGRAEAPNEQLALLGTVDFLGRVPAPKAEAGRSSAGGDEQAVAPERLAASVILCSAVDDLSRARAEVLREEDAVRRLGAGDLTRLAEEKAAASRAERTRRSALTELKERELTPLSCEEPSVARLVKCVHSMDAVSPSEWCDDADWHELAERVNWDS
jgi:hypothetical protein